MTNFDFLKKVPDFEAFSDVAISAEKLLHIDIDACVINCRRAMEFAIKWMYSVDRDLVMPYQDNLNEFEYIRENLRDLVKYIPKRRIKYITNFDEEILNVEWNDSELENDDLKNYKAKAEYYIRQHQDEYVIAKLRKNIPLNEDDIKTLENILWSEVGSKK